MAENRLRQLWKEDKPALGCWLSIPDSFCAEIVARLGFDWLCIDMQHGLIDYQRAAHDAPGHLHDARRRLSCACRGTSPGIIMRCSTPAPAAVIVPMIETPADAERAVAACRYPPAGARSFGPTRAMSVASAPTTSRTVRTSTSAASR